MNTVGIIAEFNPLHNGHAYLLNCARQKGDAVVCVLSGDFVQRGEPAVFDKRVRTCAALLNGADLVIELPAMWSMSGAEKFAYSAVKLLFDTKAVNCLSFGVNTDNLNLLKDIAKYIDSDDYSLFVKNELLKNTSFAQARQETINKKFGISEELLKDGNNILAIEYLRAINHLNFNAEIFPVKRNGAAHDSIFSIDNFASSTYLRQYIYKQDIENIKKFIPHNVLDLYADNNHTNINNISDGIIFKLKQTQKEIYDSLPDISEGIENRLLKSVNIATSYNELFELMKTKRYPNARIRRLILNAALEISSELSKQDVPYLRILGFNKKGEEIIKKIAKNASLPIIINSNQAKNLKGFAKEAFKKQCEINDIYQLCFNKPNSCTKEMLYQPIKY